MQVKQLFRFARQVAIGCVAVAIGCSSAALPSARAEVITTLDGAGADHFVAEQNSGGNGVSNLEDRLFVRTRNDTQARHEVTYLRFDLSLIGGAIDDAALELFQTSGNEITLNLYGLTDDASETISPWDPASLTYNSAPGMNTTDGDAGTSDLNLSALTPLGSFVVTTDDGITKSFSNAAMVDFLNADTNGLVTLILESQDTSATTFRSSRLDFTGDEHAPRLNLTVVPEPATGLLVGLGMFAMAAIRVRKRK